MKLQGYDGNWEQCISQVNQANQKIATAKQGMSDRITKGKGSEYFQKGCWYPENFNVVNKRILVALGDYNPLIPHAKQAVLAHKDNKEFYLTDDVLLNKKPASQVLEEIAEQDKPKPIHEKRVFDIGKLQTHDIQTDSFADDNVIVFLARGEKPAQKYGNFLDKKLGIKKITFYLPSISEKDYARGFWLCRLGGDGRSDFDGYWGLNVDGGSLFGVCESAEGTSQKTSGRIIESPRLSEILKYSKPFIAQAVRKDFEKGLMAKFKK